LPASASPAGFYVPSSGRNCKPPPPEGWGIFNRQNEEFSTGVDTIYAIYQFSQEFLGVDPLYWWTDHEPRHRRRIELAENIRITSEPRFRYRGWFLNDEDLLTGWHPGTRDGTGISLEVWDHIFEALLWLKGNMVVPGTWIFPYEPQLHAASDRGLIITQHHVNVLGLDTYRWPKTRLSRIHFRPRRSFWNLPCGER
jgi:hypothetical protein